MKTILIISFLNIFLINITLAQQVITGIVKDKKEVIIGANVYIKNTYEGSISETDGSFSFTTNQTGLQTLIVSYIGYESTEIELLVNEMNNIVVQLKESVNTIDAVEITASTFTAGDNSKSSILSSLDVVTTAGALGDNIGSLQTLPGTQSNSEDGRLFVRGGDASETNIFIDGMRVFTPYSRTVAGTPSRGRYSPFLFKGLSFSTGGYESQFGQSLSGILDMKTIDELNDNETNLSITTVGLGVQQTQKWKNQSISVNTSYTNLTPYFSILHRNSNIKKPYESLASEAVYRLKTEKGLFKSYIAWEKGMSDVQQFNLDKNSDERYTFTNQDIYSNNTLNSTINENTSFFAGISLGQNTDNLAIDSFQLESKLSGFHTKLSFKTVINPRITINYGADWMYLQNDLEKRVSINQNFQDDLSRSISAQFGNVNYRFTKNTALKVGWRAEYFSLSNTFNLQPRITFAQKINKNSQISIGYGSFQQEANSNQLFENRDLTLQSSQHYLLNYNLKNKKHSLRLEAFYKNYNNLIRTNGVNSNNNGHGSAYGVDAFWRARNWIKGVDFWLSYSWLKNERLYLNFPVLATPNYSTEHNFSIVGKKWFKKLKSQMGVTYSFASGRPYDTPNTAAFMSEKSPFYNNLSVNWSYLITEQNILFLSFSNILNFKNEFGKRYSSQANADGVYNEQTIQPNINQFFFLGLFITVSKDKSKNQLDNL